MFVDCLDSLHEKKRHWEQEATSYSELCTASLGLTKGLRQSITGDRHQRTMESDARYHLDQTSMCKAGCGNGECKCTISARVLGPWILQQKGSGIY